MNKKAESLSKDSDDIKNTQMEISEMKNRVTKIK